MGKTILGITDIKKWNDLPLRLPTSCPIFIQRLPDFFFPPVKGVVTRNPAGGEKLGQVEFRTSSSSKMPGGYDGNHNFR